MPWVKRSRCSDFDGGGMFLFIVLIIVTGNHIFLFFIIIILNILECQYPHAQLTVMIGNG